MGGAYCGLQPVALAQYLNTMTIPQSLASCQFLCACRFSIFLHSEMMVLTQMLPSLGEGVYPPSLLSAYQVLV